LGAVIQTARSNKTDRNDARGIAQMMRVGLYRPVHVKTLRSQKLRMLLTHRKLLQSKAIAISIGVLRIGSPAFEIALVAVERFADRKRAVLPVGQASRQSWRQWLCFAKMWLS
jgi:transposase